MVWGWSPNAPHGAPNLNQVLGCCGGLPTMAVVSEMPPSEAAMRSAAHGGRSLRREGVAEVKTLPQRLVACSLSVYVVGSNVNQRDSVGIFFCEEPTGGGGGYL